MQADAFFCILLFSTIFMYLAIKDELVGFNTKIFSWFLYRFGHRYHESNEFPHIYKPANVSLILVQVTDCQFIMNNITTANLCGEHVIVSAGNVHR